MASPQKENGYVPIANEIVESLARIRINGEAMQVLWVILRKTYGFNKKEDAIALSQFVSATGIKKNAVCKALAKLRSLGVVTQKENAVANKYAFVKDYSRWKPLPKKRTLPKKRMAVTQKENNRTPKRDIQKTITKDTLTKDTAQSAGGLGNEVINLFRGINASYKELYRRTPQHRASERLVELHGLEKLRKIIGFIEQRRSDRFCPSISTPIQLEDKWATLEKYALGLKAEGEIKNKPNWKIWT